MSDENLNEIFDISEPIKTVGDAKDHLNKLEKIENETDVLIQRLSEEDHGQHLDSDYLYIRENLRSLITSQRAVIERMLEVADETEHPRMFEVLSQMMRNMSETNKDLFSIQEKINEIKGLSRKQETPEVLSTTNQAIFVGSTKELQKFFKDNSED